MSSAALVILAALAEAVNDDKADQDKRAECGDAVAHREGGREVAGAQPCAQRRQRAHVQQGRCKHRNRPRVCVDIIAEIMASIAHPAQHDAAGALLDGLRDALPCLHMREMTVI